jgi:hypothetical protein
MSQTIHNQDGFSQCMGSATDKDSVSARPPPLSALACLATAENTTLAGSFPAISTKKPAPAFDDGSSIGERSKRSRVLGHDRLFAPAPRVENKVTERLKLPIVSSFPPCSGDAAAAIVRVHGDARGRDRWGRWNISRPCAASAQARKRDDRCRAFAARDHSAWLDPCVADGARRHGHRRLRRKPGGIGSFSRTFMALHG